VVIDQNPSNAPKPVGPQAPDAPVGDLEGGKGRPPSRREAIQKAFEKANVEPQPDQKKVVKRGMGDNNPPEAMEKEKPEKPPAEKAVRYREGGRFAKAPDHTQPPAPGASQRPGQQSSPHVAAAPLPENAPYREPPPRFSERGKQEWSSAPEGVRGEVYRMAKEFEGAYRQYRGDHEEMNTIRHFHQMAGEHGTTLARALTNYVGMEQKLRQDVIGGLDVIINNLGLRTSDGQKIGLRDVAYHILNQNPEQHRAIQQGNAQQAQSHQIGQLHQIVNTLAQNVQAMQTEKVFGQTRSAVDQFADTHPRFDELGDLIEQELRFGFDLETAYQRANNLRPATGRAAHTRNTTPAQTRSDKSISGAPDSGPSDGRRPKNDKPIGRREAISNAIKRVNGGV
jgi:hypothetical protein